MIVYRDELLGNSETFIRAQGESLDRFRAFYLGARHVPGLSLPDLRYHVVSGAGAIGRMQRARFKLWGAGTALQQMLAEKKPALVHAHFGPDACNAMSLARALDIPLVATFHGYDVTTSNALLPRLYVRRQELLKRSAARFLCVSEFIRQRAIEKGFPAEKMIVHYTGVDTDLFCPNPELSRLPIVLFVGRLVQKKGCEYLIRAMARAQETLPGVQLAVIGDGPLRSTLEKQAAEVLKSFQFLGMQDPAVVRNWMNRAMVFSTPSLTAESGDAEGFGMVFAEAQAMGLPVVGFASGGVPEAVAHEQTGFLAPERDWESLSEKIAALLSNQELWRRFSEAGQARVRARFDLWKQTAALENIYERVLEERACSPLQPQERMPNQPAPDSEPTAAISNR